MNWSTAALIAAVAVASTACVTVQGDSAAEIKEKLQQSFLYRSATAFADGSQAGPFDASERLRDDQKRYIVEQYQRLVDGLRETFAKFRPQLTRSFPGIAGATLHPTISMPDGGRDAPAISPDGRIFIDIRVARLMFRDAVLASMRSEVLGSPGFMSRDSDKCTKQAADAVLLRCFLEMKTRIDGLEEQGMVGMLFDKRTWDMKGDAPWFMAADMGMRSTDLSNRYVGVLLFVTAHEMGHVVLGHLDAQRARRFVSSEDRKNAERQADDFAVTLLALATGQLAPFEGTGLTSVATGFEGFFRRTYKNAGWSEESDTHPPSAERLARARKLYAEIRGRQTPDLFKVLQDWTRRLSDSRE